jgi:hypothetical protein
MPQASSTGSLKADRFSKNKDRGNFYPEVEAGRGFVGLKTAIANKIQEVTADR